jgi:hypothetical protein
MEDIGYWNVDDVLSAPSHWMFMFMECRIPIPEGALGKSGLRLWRIAFGATGVR